MSGLSKSRALALLLLSMLGAGAAQAARPVAESTDQFIVRLRSDDGARVVQEVEAIGARGGVKLALTRSIAGRIHVLRVPRQLSGAELQATLAKLSADSAVAWVQPDRRKFALALPNDPQFNAQWWLRTPATESSLASQGQPASINAEAAWDLSTGSARVVVAVLDTGVLFDHPDLGRSAAGGRILPGYDFIGDAVTANDGDGRDADPSDAGDWISETDLSISSFAGCDKADSSWHGTHIAGILSARSNNSVGVAGIGWNSWVLPLRVLGKCGGRDSDILAAMAWAAGLPVTNGVAPPANPTPARIINLSLGSEGACSAAYRDLVASLRARNALVFAAAGNDSGAVGEPANCPGVVGVAGVRHVGTKVGYSAHGPEVGIAAPAGNCINLNGNCLLPITSTDNAGTTVPGAMSYGGKLGTSFSTPMAAGVAGLMLAVNPQLPVNELVARMKLGARPFPAADPSLFACSSPLFVPDAKGVWPNDGQCNCDTASCGAGLLDAAGAVRAAAAPIAVVSAPASTNGLSTPITLDASASVAVNGASIVAWQWSLASASAAGASLSATSGAQTRLIVSQPGQYQVLVTVIDSTGRSDTDLCTYVVSAGGASGGCTTPAAAALPALVDGGVVVSPPATGGGGGGGALPWWLLGVLALALGLRRR